MGLEVRWSEWEVKLPANIPAIQQGMDHNAECPYKRLSGSACRTAAEDYTSNS